MGINAEPGILKPFPSQMSFGSGPPATYDEFTQCAELFKRIVAAILPDEHFGDNATPEYMLKVVAADPRNLFAPVGLTVTQKEYRPWGALFNLAYNLKAERPPLYGNLSRIYVYHSDPIEMDDSGGMEPPVRQNLMTTTSADNGDIAILDVHNDLIRYMYDNLRRIRSEAMNGPVH